MLRIIQNSTADGAKGYYSTASTADYYSEGQELVGVWRGEGAQRLGLEGTIERRDWDALCDNLDPRTGTTLTARQKSNRRVGYDINFHVPKSVSVLYGLTGDERVLAAFRESVDSTMEVMEAEMKTRVRVGGKDEDRTTGNMVWGEFVHFTARPVDGVPDPHLHAHCFAFNTTWDEQESRWKAGQFAGLKRDASYFEAMFHSRLALKLEALGLAVERTRKGWELAGVSKAARREFSRRTEMIEAKARAEGITDPRRKDELGAKTRGRKRKDMSLDELRKEWRGRLSSEDGEAIVALSNGRSEAKIGDAKSVARDAVAFALNHCLERSAVVNERKLLAEAMRHAYGVASPEAVRAALSAESLLSAEHGGERIVTTPTVLDEERNMLAFARDGRGACERLANEPHVFARDWLNLGQRKAVEHALQSRDRVILIRGGAGTGKTSLMQEAVAGIESGGHKVFVFAPSADASRGVLRAEGFERADTVARLLLDERLQEEVRGQVVWVDEAGLIGTRTMAHLFDLARRLDARVILSGDRGQHGAVERGAALALLEKEAGLVPAEVKDIQRQKGAYKQAVQLLAEGRTAAGFRELDALGWVKKVDDEHRDRMLAHDYVETIEAGKSVLIVSPTHREGDAITNEVRNELRNAGRLDGAERHLRVFKPENLTEAERSDPVNYGPGDVLVFHQNAKGYTKGERVAVGEGPLPLDQAARFQVFHARTLDVAPGEVLRITRNGMTKDKKHRLNNGQLVTVKRFDAQGNLVLTNGWVVSSDYGHLDYGYVVTSHASQGRTVDRVLIGQSSASLPASSREQFYVSVSRGKERATIYTDDKEALLDAVKPSDDRLSATELDRERSALVRRLELQHESHSVPEPDRRVMEHVR
jgi:conjugative relaxase-like TrwC/TraI family protein